MVGEEKTKFCTHKVHLYIEYHSVCPLVGIGTPLPFQPQAIVPPPGTKGGGGYTIHSPAGEEGVGESRVRRLEKKLSAYSVGVPVMVGEPQPGTDDLFLV